MINPQYADLIRKLALRTQEGKVNWTPTASETEFVVHFKAFSLSIRTGIDHDTSESYVSFSLRDSSGKSIDNFWVDEPEKDYDDVYRLHADARRKALRIDEAVASLIQELDSDEVIGREGPDNPDA